EEENCRFKDIENELDGISPKTLSERLKEFQRLDILEKQKFGEVPPRTEYTLTDKGRELIDCFRCMDTWAEKYDIEAEA
ncbi:MAG: helix-turn-helix domain-containing protein, partial [Candidatus Nanohaloarchaea archaeon]|nr:helix-turn-helix domain-containing protein [Candidatus Nanohaloarchaea archaeon]